MEADDRQLALKCREGREEAVKERAAAAGRELPGLLLGSVAVAGRQWRGWRGRLRRPPQKGRGSR